MSDAQATKAFPFGEGGPLAVDEVLKTKDSFTYNTSSVVAKRCADTFPKGEGYKVPHHRLCNKSKVIYKRTVEDACPYNEEMRYPAHP